MGEVNENIRNTAPNELKNNREELQKAANYRLLKNNLIPRGVGSIIFGIIAIGTGIFFMRDSSLNIILAIIGIFLTAEGIWLISAPHPKGLIIDGMALLILGIWNIAITVINLIQTFAPVSIDMYGNVTGGFNAGYTPFVTIGVYQIIWSIQSFQRYPRFSKLPMSKPSAQMSKRIDHITKDIKKANIKNSPNIIEFKGRQRWKGRLGTEDAIFVAISGNDLVFVRKDEVAIANKKKVLIGKTLNVTLRIGDRVMRGKISPESYERYKQWKTEPA